MKTELPQIYFTFDPANQTIDFSATPSFDPARLFAVMNITDQQKLIYAVASYAQGFGGSFAGSVLTLTYDTTSMSAGDILQVIYDDESLVQDVEVTNFPSIQDVNVTSSVLPTDASTATLQGVGNASLSSIDGKIITTVDGIKVDGSAVTQPVSAVSLPLPAGASTEATLQSVDGKITVVDTSDVTITGALPSGTNTIGKVDVNGTIPVSGSVSVTNFPVTQDVSVSSSVLPTGASTELTLSSLNAKVITVDTGNVTVSNFPASQDVVVTSTVLPPDGATETTLSAINAKIVTADTGNVTITAPLPAGANLIGSVDINSGSIIADLIAEAPTGGAVPSDAVYVGGNDSGNLIGIKVSSTGVVSVDGSATTQPISASSLPLPTGASTEATLSNLDSKVTTTPNGVRVDPGSVTIGSSVLPTGASTEATLSSLDSKVSTTPNGIRVDAVGTVDIGSSVLPTGASTEATLSSIDTKLTTTPNGLRVDAVGTVDIGSSVLPTGASTEATLSNLDSKVITTPNGIKVDVLGTVDVGSSVLPTGASTEATLSSIDTKLTTTPGGLRVDAVGTVDIGSSVLPTGASTEATLSSIDTKLTTTPNGLRVDAVGTVDIGSSVLPTGASTEATLSNLDSKVTTTVNGVKVDAVVSSGQIDSYAHDGSGNAITSTSTGGKQALDVNLAGGSVVASNPSVNPTGSPVPADATFIGGTDGTNLVGIKVDSNGVVSANPEGHVDTNNSSTLALGSAGVFTGAWTDITNYSSIFLGINSNVASATDGIEAQFSHDGVSVDHTHKYNFSGVVGIGISVIAEYKYYRLKYTNGAGAQSFFVAQSILKPNMILPSTYNLTYPLNDNFQAIVTRSVITGQTTAGGGSYVNVKVNPSGALVTDSTISGTVAVTQSGTWDINNISGTVTLPTGASTEATLSALNSKVNTTPSGIQVDPGSVTIGSSVLPTGASTEATLLSVDTKLTTTPSGLRVDPGTLTIGSSVLPTGASTEATLLSVDTKLTTTPGGLRVDPGSITVGSSVLPMGASTEATLLSVDTKLTTTPNGLRVDPGSITVGSSVLPMGASTEATLLSVDTKLTTTPSGLRVDPGSITVGSSVLPMGASTEATLLSVDTKLTTTPSGLRVDPGSITVGSSVLPMGASTEATLLSVDTKLTTTPNGLRVDPGSITVGSSVLPTGAATEATLLSIDNKISTTPNGIQTEAVISGIAKVAVTNSKGQFIRSQYDLNPVDTSTYYELIPSTSLDYSAIEIFDSSGQTLILSIGAFGFEVDQFLIFPGGNGRIPYSITAGSRISIIAVSGDATSGEICINFYV